MTQTKTIKKAPLPTQVWFDGFEQYRQQTALFPHPEEPAPKKLSGAVLPGFDEMMAQTKKKRTTHCATFPMLPYKGKIR